MTNNPATPWSAAVSGPLGDLDAVNASAQLNQDLATHASTALYVGNRIIGTYGTQNLTWIPMSAAQDYSQKFTMSGTSLGRIMIPLLPTGNGASVLASIYPDNGAGSPDRSAPAIASTYLPAAYLNQVCATSGLENTTSPLQTALNNTLQLAGGVTTNPWPAPAGDSTGTTLNSVITSNGNFILFLGGFAPGTGNPLPYVNTAQFNGGTDFSAPIPQPSLPQSLAFGGAAIVSDNTLLHVGGNIPAGTLTLTANVWAASWDPGTGTVGSWSSQQAMPAALNHPSVVGTSAGQIYVIGGSDVSNNPLSSVYWATVTNGQLQSWNTAAPLPTAVSDAMSAVVGGYLIVVGGRPGPSSTVPVGNAYYAKINADGSLGTWNAAPTLPNAQYAFASGWAVAATDNCMLILSGHTDANGLIQMISVDEAGPAPTWLVRYFSTASGVLSAGDIPGGVFSNGDGSWAMVCPLTYASIYSVYTLTPTPYVSVPFAATMTNGNNYHVVLQMGPSASASDGVSVGVDSVNGVSLADAIQANRYSNSWSAILAGYSILCRWYDASPVSSYPNYGSALHTWADGGNRWSSTIPGTNSMPAGLLEVTEAPANALNSNPTFATSTSPWTATNGTITRSSAQTHGGFAFSGLLTPTGGLSQAYIQSEQFSIFPFGSHGSYTQPVWINANGWFYSPTGWANFMVNVNWFDPSGAYISTGVGATVNLAANTWTYVSSFQGSPAGAAFASIVAAETATPGATNLLYASNFMGVITPEATPAVTSAVSISYDSTGVLPVSVTQLN